MGLRKPRDELRADSKVLLTQKDRDLAASLGLRSPRGSCLAGLMALQRLTDSQTASKLASLIHWDSQTASKLASRNHWAIPMAGMWASDLSMGWHLDLPLAEQRRTAGPRAVMWGQQIGLDASRAG